MPTGYTAAIKDGISFEKFVWTCARAFGALAPVRDDPMDAPIPQAFETSPYHANALAKARTELTRLLGLTTHERSVACAAANEAAVKTYADVVAGYDALRDKYKAMLAKVHAWEPPTADHNELKYFMVEQITQSIDFDCSTKYLRSPVHLTPDEWYAKQIKSAEQDIAYHLEEQAKEEARTAERNAWLKALRESVPPAP